LRGQAGKWIAASLTPLLFATSVQAKPAIIVRNGRSDYQIVTPEDKSPAVENKSILTIDTSGACW
jgi:hypothetical protein